MAWAGGTPACLAAARAARALAIFVAAIQRPLHPSSLLAVAQHIKTAAIWIGMVGVPLSHLGIGAEGLHRSPAPHVQYVVQRLVLGLGQ